MKKTFWPALLASIFFIFASSITILVGLFYLIAQKFNPLMTLAIIAVGIINLYLGINLNKQKSWPYYSLILYIISGIIIVLINPLLIYLKLSSLIVLIMLFTIYTTNSEIKRFYHQDELDSFQDVIKNSWKFTKEDSKPSWAIVISLILILMKFALFPLMTLLTGTSLPIVIVESCSMYHESSFNDWWDRNSGWYENNDISKSEFSEYPFVNGMNKGDIILVQAAKEYNKGEVIIFKAPTKHPIIHRIVSLSPIETKGDHNLGQIEGIETSINETDIIGKATFKIPYLGWIKLIFFEPFQSDSNKGFCA
jgi:hypothetical protein